MKTFSVQMQHEEFVSNTWRKVEAERMEVTNEGVLLFSNAGEKLWADMPAQRDIVLAIAPGAWRTVEPNP